MKLPQEILSERDRGISNNVDVNKRIFYDGTVKNTEDPNDARRIKVRIKGIDDNTTDDQLPWCSPLIPIVLNINPEVDEVVYVQIPDMAKPSSNRTFIGPLIPQFDNVSNSQFYNSAQNNQSQARSTLNPSYKQKRGAQNLFPERSDVALVGRDNADLILKKKSFKIRSGKHKNNKLFEENINPAIVGGNIKDDFSKSYVVNQSNTNFLISHKENLSPDVLQNLSYDQLVEITEQMLLGNQTVDLLRLIIRVLLTHTHGYHNLPATPDANVVELQKKNVEDVLSDDNRLN